MRSPTPHSMPPRSFPEGLDHLRMLCQPKIVIATKNNPPLTVHNRNCPPAPLHPLLHHPASPIEPFRSNLVQLGLYGERGTHIHSHDELQNYWTPWASAEQGLRS